ncbi:tumor necrosis factor receptor superfamily member 5 isoform X1 [Hyperolius riggenbachi]|uniref:tumor necrosis factor receptor superfamily member 5 isoform X1 n=1 Tax=Hyperolius riggenbachi TaxID=752182 RepID=UPI0035A2B386
MLCWVLLLIFGSCYHQGSSYLCNPSQYEKDNKCCSLCRPGQSLVKECSANSDTECMNCKAGEYQDKWNRETSCILHTDCDENRGFTMLSDGTTEKNVNCSCQEGKHCSNANCETCISNTPCGPGEGVTQKANRFSDTQCAPCPEGTFSNVTSDTEACIKWQSCPDSQKEVHQGTDITDVVCGPHQTNSVWIYVLLVVIALTCLSALFILFVQNQKKKKRKILKEPDIPQPLVEHQDKAQQCVLLEEELTQDNIPIESEDLTIQGLPFAQEQGKDYHMSQEED